MKGTIRVRVSYDDGEPGELWQPRAWPVLSLHRDFTLVDSDSAVPPTGAELQASRGRAATLAQGAFSAATGFISDEALVLLAERRRAPPRAGASHRR